MAILFAAVALTAVSAGAPALAADISGRASVIDGDTLDIHGTRIRLHGIDAPESGQTCHDGGVDWRCGQQAALALDDMISGRPVACAKHDVDRYGRIVAVCRVGGRDANAWMVRLGWALAYRKYSRDYVGEEAEAQAAGRGVWRGAFVAPWEWRRGERLQAAKDERPDGCAIKGNIASDGERIYHIPGGQFYSRTRVDTGAGERWFCSETEARGAGWRRSQR